MRTFLLSVLCLALAAGCVVTKRLDDGRLVSGDDYGLTVKVCRDGSVLLHGRALSRDELVDRLRKEAFVEDDKGRPAQRAVILEAQQGVREAALVSLREHLVANGMPRVVLRTAHNFHLDDGDEDPGAWTIQTAKPAAQGRAP